MLRRTLLFVLPLFATLGCQAASGMYYNALEKVGIPKRDLLAGRIEKAREDQTEAKEQIQTTLEAFKAVTNFDGGELEDMYEKLKDEYEDSVDAADTVTDRIDSIESVSTALFSEWRDEIDLINDASMRRKSENLMSDSQKRYDELITTMRNVESKMKPVLSAFNDRVLFLKHNLNAEMINSLKDTNFEIEDSVQSLIKDMQDSIDEADEFLKTLEAPAA